MNAPEAVAMLYEAVHPFGTAYQHGDIFAPKDVAKLQAAVFEVDRSIKLGEVTIASAEVAIERLDQLGVTTILYRTARKIGRAAFPGDRVTADQIGHAVGAVEVFARALKLANQAGNPHGLRIRKAARA